MKLITSGVEYSARAIKSPSSGDCLILYGNKEEIEKKFLVKDGKEKPEDISRV